LYEEAIEQPELPLSVHSEMSPALFQINPARDPLCDHSKFRNELGILTVKTG
jgi:hypothetical protein